MPDVFKIDCVFVNLKEIHKKKKKNVKKELSGGGYSGNEAVMLRFRLTVYFSRCVFSKITLKK